MVELSLNITLDCKVSTAQENVDVESFSPS